MTPRTFALHALLLIAILPLAGCATETSDTEQDTLPDQSDTTGDHHADDHHADDHDADDHHAHDPGDAIALHLVDAPGAHTAGTPYTLMFHITAPAGKSSDHAGAHWGPASTNEPSLDAYPSACEHQGGEADQVVTVTCDLPVGVHYMRGHWRLTDADGPQHDHWTDEWRIEVAPPVAPTPSFTLLVQDLPATVNAGEAFNYTLVVSGDGNATSDHIGGHFGTVSTTEPSTDVYDVSCAHVTGDLPGTFTISCTAPEAGTFYLRGHARILDANGDPVNLWGDEVSFQAS